MGGQLQYRRSDDWQKIGLRVKVDQWNVIRVDGYGLVLLDGLRVWTP